MSEPKMPEDVAAEVFAEEKRSLNFIVDFITRHPDFRRHMAYATLGHAVAICDAFGCDVEAWLRELRRIEPKPPVLVPPRSS
jgi:hypothetical protein